MKKQNLTILIAIVLIVLLTIFFFADNAGEELQKVRIGYLNIVASLPLFVAEEEGYLRAEGIEYETIPMSSSNQLVDGIISGQMDCFIESSAVPVLAVELQSPNRLKVFSVSEITSESPFDALLVKEDSAIATLADLVGKKIGVFPGSTATNLLKKFLADKGLDVSNILFVPMPPPNHLTALLGGSVDVIHAYEPTTAIALSKGGIRQLHGSAYAEMISPNPQGVSVINTTFAQEHPKTAAKVIKALEKAMTYMKTHDKETRQILAKRMSLSQDVAARCIFLYMLPHDQIDVQVFQKYADMLTDLGELQSRVEVSELVYR